jgi:hypothetical protein
MLSASMRVPAKIQSNLKIPLYISTHTKACSNNESHQNATKKTFAHIGYHLFTFRLFVWQRWV